MIPNFKTDAKMLGKTLLQILGLLLVLFVILCVLFFAIADDYTFIVGPEPCTTEATVGEGH